MRIKRDLEKLNENSLRTLCLSLGLNFDDLGGNNKIVELLSFMQRDQRMPDLDEAIDNLLSDAR